MEGREEWEVSRLEPRMKKGKGKRMKKAAFWYAKALFATAILLVLLSGCSFATKSYTIYLKLGHVNVDDPGPISIYVTGMIPSEGGTNLSYSEFVPADDSYIEHVVSLSDPKDFTIYVESSKGDFSAKYEIEDGAYYSFYYVASDEYDHVMGTKIEN